MPIAGGRTLEATAWYQQSSTPGRQGDDAAYAVGFDIPNAQGWRGGASFKELGRNFNPALGFVSRTGVSDALGQVGYTHFVKGRKFLQSVAAGVDAERVSFLTGGLETQVLFARLLDLEFKPGEETLEVALFDEAGLPWKEIAFRTVGLTLKRWPAANARRGAPIQHARSDGTSWSRRSPAR